MSTALIDPVQRTVVDNLLEVLRKARTVEDLGPALTCTEAEAFVWFLEVFEAGDLASQLMEAHVDSDEEGDPHWGGKSDYVLSD